MKEVELIKEEGPLAAFADWEAAKEVPIELLVFCDWNVNEMSKDAFDELVEEIDRTGFDEPAQIVPITKGDDKGKFLVIGGEHRVKACKVIGWATVPCMVKDHLDPEDEEELMIYSVRRNNIRGKINAQKFAELENRVSARKKIAVEVARKRMFIRGEMLKKLRKTTAIIENEDDETEKGGRKKLTKSSSPIPKSSKISKTGAAPPPPPPPSDPIRTNAERQRLIANLRALEQEVLLKCETIEHGYIFFGQSGSSHLVVQETKHLYKLVEQMAGICKRDSSSVNEFLTSAISKEIKNWEK
jgi:hypothetical protein